MIANLGPQATPAAHSHGWLLDFGDIAETNQPTDSHLVMAIPGVAVSNKAPLVTF